MSRAVGLSVVSLVAALASVPLSQALSDSTPVVEFQNGRISIQATDVPLKELLSEMGQKSGIVVELKDTEAAERPLSITLRQVPPTRAFRRVLRDLNYAFVYSEDRLSQVLILPRGAQIPPGQLAKGPSPTRSSEGRLDRPGKGSSRAKREALALKRDMDPRVRAELAAIAELEESDDVKSIAALGNRLADPIPQVRSAALSALTAKEGSSATQMIRRGLTDRDPELRIEALEALAERNDIESLRSGLTDPNEDVRERAAELLEESTP
jgi:hypothetical protein